MANDRDQNNNTNKPREVVKDNSRSPVRMGLGDEKATISFKFDHKPADIKDTVVGGYGLPDDYAVKKPAAKVEAITPKNNTASRFKNEAKAAISGAGSKVREQIDKRRELARASRAAAIERKRQAEHEHQLAAKAEEESAKAAADFDALNKAVEQSAKERENGFKEEITKIEERFRQFVKKQSEEIKTQQENWDKEQEKQAKIEEKKKAAEKAKKAAARYGKYACCLLFSGAACAR